MCHVHNKDMSSNDDYFQKQDTPEWAKVWKFTHFSPSQANNPDDTWIANYFIASREERKVWAYNPNVIFGNAIHQGIGLVAKKTLSISEASTETVKQLMTYMHKDEKERMQIERMKEVAPQYISNAVNVLNAIKPLKKLQFIREKSRSLELPRLELPIVMYTDLEYEDQGVELKIKPPSFRGYRKDGKPSYARGTLPNKPSIEHLRQVACYWYTAKKPFRIMYVNEKEARVFDSSNCEWMTDKNLELAMRYLQRIFIRRQTLMKKYTELEDVAKVLNCDFSSFYWNGCPKRVLMESKKVFKVEELK